MKNSRIVIFSFLLTLGSSSLYAGVLDLGFKGSNWYLKTILSEDFSKIQFEMTHTLSDAVKPLTKCFLSSAEIEKSLNSLFRLEGYGIINTDIEKLKTDLTLIISGSGYSQFTTTSDFLKPFKIYLQLLLPAKCIYSENFIIP